ncbi:MULTISPECIES: VTT domain-containing protein [Bacillaceae]|uniref:TVP38/TMEM64 family protein n=1 Tax=Bacillaceae TaxID=186817 RepID=UPI001E2B5E25|nr:MULTISPECIES: VTT domain-containing protein [Bacillaceae]MCE4051215.1 VTT domain-containing protein [Bacillus sp. Au-Bac7]MCM3029892.1 VTT domain-containing protein [Niallia sp. MER 6]UPO86815.1 VTT domain-containing protein [Niallia sp. Man26]
MEDQLSMLFVMVELGGVLAPIAFILFHTLRQVLFIPPMLVCIAGGVLFGVTFGTIYSVIGLTVNCLFFFLVINRMPKTRQRLSGLKKKWFGEYRNLTTGQVAVLRLIPFIHYHLLNFCLLERTKNFKDYMKFSLMTNIPLAFFYTIFGQFISQFSPTMIIVILFALAVLVYVLREKMTIIKWHEFFKDKKQEKKAKHSF